MTCRVFRAMANPDTVATLARDLATQGLSASLPRGSWERVPGSGARFRMGFAYGFQGARCLHPGLIHFVVSVSVRVRVCVCVCVCVCACVRACLHACT